MLNKRFKTLTIKTCLMSIFISTNLFAAGNTQSIASDIANIVNEVMQIQSRKGHVINLAGKQRMLTQKMSKEALLIILNVNVEGNKRFLNESAYLYDKTLKGLINGDKELNLAPTKTKKILDHLKLVQAEWTPFYKSIQKIVNNKKVDNKAFLNIVKNNEKLLRLSHKAVQLYKDDENFDTLTDQRQTNIIDIAGRQRMLTQKMLKEKILIVGGMDVKKNKGKLRGSTMLFNRSLKGLLHGDEKFGIVAATNSNIRDQLTKVFSIWSKIYPIYGKAQISEEELETLIVASDPLLAEMSKAVKLIEQTADY